MMPFEEMTAIRDSEYGCQENDEMIWGFETTKNKIGGYKMPENANVKRTHFQRD